jgi:hypothetical protein
MSSGRCLALFGVSFLTALDTAGAQPSHNGVSSCAISRATIRPYCLAKSIVHSLGDAHYWAVAPEFKGATTTIDKGAAIFLASQKHKKGLTYAIRDLEPLISLRDTSARRVASLFLLGYTTLIAFQDSSDSGLRRQMGASVSQGVFAEYLATLKGQREDGETILDLGAGHLMRLLTAQSRLRGDSAGAQLEMSLSERDDLLRDLRSSFGSNLEPVAGEYASHYAILAHFLVEFLADKRVLP